MQDVSSHLPGERTDKIKGRIEDEKCPWMAVGKSEQVWSYRAVDDGTRDPDTLWNQDLAAR